MINTGFYEKCGLLSARINCTRNRPRLQKPIIPESEIVRMVLGSVRGLSVSTRSMFITFLST